MKAKLKNPDVAKKKGHGHVKISLKKFLKEGFSEPLQFFYDAEFDYGQKDPKTGKPLLEPIMYIGEVTGVWKKWIKEIKGKTSKTFAAGRCVFDPTSKVLKLEVKMGKGGKNPILKQIVKSLLKPFAKPIFVDSLDSSQEIELAEGEAVETTAETAGTEFNINLEDYIKEIKEIVDAGTSMLPVLGDIIQNVYDKYIKGQSLKSVSDELIELFKSTMNEINNNDYKQLLSEAKNMINNLSSDNELQALISAGGEEDGQLSLYEEAKAKLSKFIEDIEALSPPLAEVINTGLKVKKVEDPAESDFPPVSVNPFEHLISQFNLQSKSQAEIKAAAEMMKNI
jgi:hypothetical protein